MPADTIRLHSGTPVPPRLIETVARWPGQHDLTPGWLHALPDTVADVCSRWEITLDLDIPDTFITLVLLGHSNRLGPVVIKSSPLADEFRAEATALGLAASSNVARQYDVDLDRSVMVIERIVPGTQLKEVAMSDDDATRLAATTVATMWRPVPDPSQLVPLRHWMRALFNWSPRENWVATDLIADAQVLAKELLDRSTRTSLLHGDFQHQNLLRRESGDWAIIDPKGLYGDPGFEVAAWMYNPSGVVEQEDYLDVVRRRLEICSAIWGIDQRDLIAWAYAGAVLSACWYPDDDAPGSLLRYFERGARQLRTLLP